MRLKRVFAAEIRTLAFLTLLVKINMIPKERKYPMGMFDPKKRKLVTAIIAVILVLAMVVPTVISLLL